MALRFALQHFEETHEFVANEAGVETEENSQECTSANTIQELRFRQEHKNENPESGHPELGARKEHRAVSHNSAHDGIDFDHAKINQLQRQKGVSNG